MIRTVSPGSSLAVLTRRFQAVGAWRMITAASLKASPAGTATAMQAGSATSCAKPPGRLMPIMPVGPA